MAITADRMGQILRDINQEKPPRGYTAEELAFREESQKELDEARKTNPGAMFDVATGLEGLPGDDD